MLRPTPLRRYLSVMRERGFVVERVLAGTGLQAQCLDDPRYLIEASQYQAIVANMLMLAGDSGLGLDVGMQRDVKDFGILGYAALSCRSIRHSVEEFWGSRGGYGEVMGMMAKVVIPRGNSETVTVDITAPEVTDTVYRFFVEEALCLLLKVGAQVSGIEPRFSKLELSYPRPPYAARYAELFQCPVVFKAARTRASFNRSWFESPLQTSDPELIQLYTQKLSQMRAEIAHHQPLPARLLSLFAERRTVPPLEIAARDLGLSPRTLRRQLMQQQHSYRELATRYRLEQAMALLKTGTVAAKQISEHAGFSDVNAFRRAFKAWTGQTLSKYRETSRAR